MAYTLKSLSVNELLATDYDFLICTNPPVCSQLDRFGDVILRQRGNPTDQQWVWYGIAVILSEYFIFIILNTLALNYLRIEASPPAPLPTDKHIHHSEEIAVEQLTVTMKAEDTELSIPFQPATIAFQNIWYTIKLKKSGEELDILKDISGYFEPKTLTALMGCTKI